MILNLPINLFDAIFLFVDFLFFFIGHFGKGSVMALQRFLNGKGYNLKVDGSMGKATVMAWQRYLNAHN